MSQHGGHDGGAGPMALFEPAHLPGFGQQVSSEGRYNTSNLLCLNLTSSATGLDGVQYGEYVLAMGAPLGLCSRRAHGREHRHGIGIQASP